MSSKDQVVGSKKGNKMLLVVIIVILILAGGYIFYTRNKNVPGTTSDTDSQGASVAGATRGEEALLAEAIEKVGKLIAVPEGESPVLLTVSDPEQLRGQPFFDTSKVGDQVLIYQKAGKAFLYDPVANKILEVATVGFETSREISPTAEESNSSE